MKRYLKENLLTILILLAMVAIWICIPFQIKAQVAATGVISPRFFPQFSVACTFISTALLLILNAIQTFGRPAKDDEAKKDDNVSYFRAFLVVVMLFIWYLVVKRIGFCISTTLLMFGISFLLGNRNKLSLVLVPVCFSFGVYFVFRMLLHVALPEVLF